MTSSTQRFLRISAFRRAAVLGILSAVGLSVGAATVSARPTQPSAADRQITFAVATLMERTHLTGQSLDDKISERCLDTFIKELDPLKLFFYQSDIDEFKRNRTLLDDAFKRGDIRFAYEVFARFLARVDERVQLAHAELDKQHDFAVDEEMIRDPEAAEHPKTPEEAAERWRQRVKFDLMKELADDVPMDEAVKKLRKRYLSIRNSWQQTDNEELLERYLSAMTTGFDPHSSYMAPTTLDNFNITMKLELDGIGASLRAVDGYTVVQNIIPGGAADKQGGLKPEDKIVGVGDGPNGPIEDIVDMKLNDVVKKIRGKRGTIVRLEVDPADNSERKTISITRDRIELKDSEARSEVIERGKKADGTPYRLGAIQLPSFYMDMDGARMGLDDYKSTTRDVRRLLEEFKTQEVDAVVIDLRWNGGGSLTEAVNMTGLFIDNGPVVQVKGPDGRSQPYKDPESGLVWEGPLVVIINKFSASASEIFAGAIQDYRRGIVIGDHATHGKGTVQQLFDLDNKLLPLGNRGPRMGALKLTIQQFYRPGGDSTQNRGVVSDVELPSLTTHLDVGESDLDYALKFDRVGALPHDTYHMVDSSVIDGLRERSRQRIAQSEYFTKANHQIERYEEQKDRKTITLNKEKFLAERKELDSDKEQEELFENMTDPTRPVYEMDGYGQEAIDITVDYLDLLGGNKIAVARQEAAIAQ
ncbi:MAG: carboxy terminal-processing peptidase [Planctomycetes bacterium]|nr:carboxy terminal-processing peptidase [Planctomycetota bacterium]